MEGTHLNGILNFIHGRYHHNYVVLKQSCFYYTGSFESFNSFEIHLNSENVIPQTENKLQANEALGTPCL